METNYQITAITDPEQVPWGIIGGGLNQFNACNAGENHYEQLCFVLRDADNQIVGGVIAATYWEWLYVDLLFLPEELRKQGHGQRLLAMAEKEGRKRGAKQVYLDTFDWQARGFYEKQGYEVFGELDNFPPGHQRYFMRKEL